MNVEGATEASVSGHPGEEVGAVELDPDQLAGDQHVLLPVGRPGAGQRRLPEDPEELGVERLHVSLPEVVFGNFLLLVDYIFYVRLLCWV